MLVFLAILIIVVAVGLGVFVHPLFWLVLLALVFVFFAHDRA